MVLNWDDDGEAGKCGLSGPGKWPILAQVVLICKYGVSWQQKGRSGMEEPASFCVRRYC